VYNPEAQEAYHAFCQTSAGQEILSSAHRVQAQLAPYTDSLKVVILPYAQQLSAKAAPLLEAVKVQVAPLAHQIISHVSSSLAQVKASVAYYTGPSGQIVS